MISHYLRCVDVEVEAVFVILGPRWMCQTDQTQRRLHADIWQCIR